MVGAVDSINLIYYNRCKCLNPSSSVPSSMYSNVKTTAGMLGSLTTSISDTHNTYQVQVRNGLGCINQSPSSVSSGMAANKKSRKSTSHYMEEIRLGVDHTLDADPICSVGHLVLRIVLHD
jgi:hypothetical protein